MLRNLLSRLWYGKPALHATDSDSDATSEASISPLEDFNQKLQDKREKINRLLKQWEQSKIEVIGKDVDLAAHEEASECDLEKVKPAKSIFEEFRKTVKEYFETASVNLQEQLDNEFSCHGHVKELEDHINALCEKADKASLTPVACRKNAIHLCNANIVMLNELSNLTNGFAEEIYLSVSTERKEEQVAKFAINALLTIITGFVGVSLPLVDFNCQGRYKNLLNKAITNQKAGFMLQEAGAEGVEEKAAQIVKGYTEKLRGSGGIFPQPVAVVENNVDVVEAPSPL
jgi:hypothetical protein